MGKRQNTRIGSASRADSVYAQLLEDIAEGRWSMEETTSAYALATRLGVSRTPVVEALKRLEAEGLIEIAPNVGSRLIPATPEALIELRSLASALLGLAAERAAQLANDDAIRRMDLLLEEIARAEADRDAAEARRMAEAIRQELISTGLPTSATATGGLVRTLRAQLRRHIGSETDPVGLAELQASVRAIRVRSPRRARAAAERHIAAIADAAERDAQLGGAGRAPAGLVHTALIYRSTAEFIATALPFVLEGLQRDEPVLVVSRDDNLDALSSALGADAFTVDYRESGSWYDHPAAALRRFRRYIAERARGSRVRIIGEPPWRNRDPASVEAWLRYESVINVALEADPASIMCPYDARELPEHILGGARCAHSHLHQLSQLTPSADFRELFPS